MLRSYDKRGFLDCSNKGYFTLPEEVKEAFKRNIQTIYIGLQHNSLNHVPQEIQYLKFLEIVDLSGNILTEVDFPPLDFISILDLSDNKITSLSRSLFELKSLVALNLSYNEISKIPKEIANLTNLQEINLELNKLCEIHTNFYHLSSLKYVNMRRNSIKDLHREIGNMTALECIDLSFNSISKITPSLLKLNSLRRIILDNNPMVDPPILVCALGTSAIKSHLYLEELRKSSLLKHSFSNRKSSNTFSERFALPSPSSHDCAPPLAVRRPSVPARPNKSEHTQTPCDISEIANEIQTITAFFERKLKVNFPHNFDIFSYLSDGVALCKVLNKYRHTGAFIVMETSSTKTGNLTSKQKQFNVRQFINNCYNAGMRNQPPNAVNLILSAKPSKVLVKVLAEVTAFIQTLQEK